MESKSEGKYKQKYFARPNLSFPSPVPPACYQITLLVGLSEFWWFSSVDIIPPWFSMLIYHLGCEQ
jgi:hypothetical protein